MFTRSVKIYNTKRIINDNYEYTFPEQVDTNKSAICLSGGGMRSLVCSNGYFTFLSRYGLLDNLSYLSSVSGGSWFSGIYTFTDIYFGDYKEPEDLTLFNLYTSNFDQMFFVPNICLKIPITHVSILVSKESISLSKVWPETINMSILDHFGLYDRVCVESYERQYELNLKYNTDRYIAPIKNRPFWICCASILADNGNVTFPMTTMYSGLPKVVKYRNNLIGNYYVETSCFGSFFDDYEATSFSEFKLCDMLGTSSAAFAELTNLLNNNGLYEFSEKIEHVIPKYKFAYFGDNIEYCDVEVVDGERANNTAILPLLARGCKKICMFNNNVDINNGIDVFSNPLSYYCNTCLLELFGMCDRNCYFYPSVDNRVQVFESKYWQLLYDQFQNCIEQGGPVYCHVKIPVLENKHNSIKGGYEVELLIYLLYPSVIFTSRLSKEIRSQICKDGIFENFPNYSTLFQNTTSVLELKREQINLLHYYVQWCCEETKDVIFSFLKK